MLRAAAGREPELAELPIAYSDFAAWQREQLSGEALEADLAYWRDRLATAPERIDIPSDRPRPAVKAIAASIGCDPSRRS